MDGVLAVFTRTRIVEEDPDAKVVARCKAGDTEAFSEIVDRYQTMVASVVARSLRDPDDAADVVQEVFVRAFRGLKSFRSEAKFSTWLYRIALNTAMRQAGKVATDRKWRVEPDPDPESRDLLSSLPSDPDEAPDVVVWKQMSHAGLREAVHGLPDKQREVVILHFFEGKTCDEIAEVLEISVGTVWSRIHYAVKRLRGVLKDWA